MGIRTISLREEAYERLRRARRTPTESFSDVVMRAVWPDDAMTAGAYLRLLRERGPVYSPDELARLEESKSSDVPPPDKWTAG